MQGSVFLVPGLLFILISPSRSSHKIERARRPASLSLMDSMLYFRRLMANRFNTANLPPIIFKPKEETQGQPGTPDQLIIIRAFP